MKQCLRISSECNLIVMSFKVLSKAPSKCILSGEHSVVYGKPAITMALDRCSSVEGVYTHCDEFKGLKLTLINTNSLHDLSPAIAFLSSSAIAEFQDLANKITPPDLSKLTPFLNSAEPPTSPSNLLLTATLLVIWALSQADSPPNPALPASQDLSNPHPDSHPQTSLEPSPTSQNPLFPLPINKLPSLACTLTLDCPIPSGAGLGSSASVFSCIMSNLTVSLSLL